MDRVGLGVAIAVLLVGLVIGWWRRSTGGRLRRAGTGVPHDDPDRLDPALRTALGVEPAAATLLQFSSAFCAPCRTVRRISADVAALLPGVRHVEVDAERHLDAVRALNVWQTPTLFVLDSGGRIVQRATGVPAKPQLIAAVAELLPARESAPEHR